MKNIHVVSHPLLHHSLTIIRNKDTDTENFRRHTAIVSQIMIMEATRNISLLDEEIQTPLATMTGHKIRENIIFVPVLRAGLSMLFPSRDFLPWAPVGFIGLKRDEQTAIAHEYYQKFPFDLKDKHIMVLDPMLATGGSLVDTISALKKKGAETITAVCIVAAPEGVKNLSEQFPEVNVFVAAIDSHLNADKYIYPGLGDYGDRYFNT
ncbi:MAG: uracil phosphoribosyltransferase [Candidatus Marinimicrobia bacterium]|nr:uracil phosphoribosyltransferase [Candidatus Neomarinimicrobiota bacterium]